MDASSILSDDDYDVVSNPGQRSLESSTTDFGHIPARTIYEPAPSQNARDKFETVSWTASEIQAFMQKTLGSVPTDHTSLVDERTRRVYVDGIFDTFTARHALQLRQAKLSFPSVHLIVGVYSDEQLKVNGYTMCSPHTERCEVVRHCRWVDEVFTAAPWVLDSQFIDDSKIDYVAVEEGTSVDPGCDNLRLKGYDEMKSLGIAIPTRKTVGLWTPPLTQESSPVAEVGTALAAADPMGSQS